LPFYGQDLQLLVIFVSDANALRLLHFLGVILLTTSMRQQKRHECREQFVISRCVMSLRERVGTLQHPQQYRFRHPSTKNAPEQWMADASHLSRRNPMPLNG